jgi:putative transposase
MRWQAAFTIQAYQTLSPVIWHHASIHNHFNHDRYLNRRDIFKQNRSVALAEWRQLAA